MMQNFDYPSLKTQDVKGIRGSNQSHLLGKGKRKKEWGITEWINPPPKVGKGFFPITLRACLLRESPQLSLVWKSLHHLITSSPQIL